MSDTETSHTEMSHMQIEGLYNRLRDQVCRAIRNDTDSCIWSAVEVLAKVQPSMRDRDDVFNTLGGNVVEHIARRCRFLAGVK
jgi:hypothetical protein